MMWLVALLLAVSITRVRGQTANSFDNDDPSFCCNSQPGPQLSLTPISAIEAIYSSPNYGIYITAEYSNPYAIDNICYTFLPLSNDSALRFTGSTYCDGSYVISQAINSVLPGYVSVGRIEEHVDDGGSTSLVYDEVLIGTGCDGLTVWVRNFLCGSCDVLNQVIENPATSIHVESTNKQLSAYCHGQIASVINSQNIQRVNLTTLPNTQPYHCVTELKGIQTVNADRVCPQDSVVLG